MWFSVLISAPFFCVGMFMVIGSIKGVKSLVEPPKGMLFSFPYFLLNKLGPNTTKYYHIVVGLLIAAASITFAILLNGIL